MPSASEVHVKVTGDAEGLNHSLSEAKEHIEAFGKIGESILQGFGLALGQLSFETLAHGIHHLLEEFIDVNAAAEVFQAQLKVLLGTADKARERMEALGNWAKKAPFELTDIREANRLLQVFGGDALAGADGMNLIGNAAAFAQVPISTMAETVGRFHASLESGGSDPMVLRTLRHYGILSGEALGHVQKLMKEHASGTVIWDAFAKGIARTDGQMKAMMQTFRGQTTNFKDVMHELIHEVGQPFFMAAKEGLIKVLEWLNGPDGHKVQEQLVQLGAQFGAWAQAAGPKFFTTVSQGVVKLFDFLSSAQGQEAVKHVSHLIAEFAKFTVIAFAVEKATTLIVEPLMALYTGFTAVAEAAIAGEGAVAGIAAGFPLVGTAIELLSGPVGWIIGAVGVIYEAWIHNWGGIREFIAQTADQLKEIWAQIMEGVTALTGWVTANWETIKQATAVVWETVGAILSFAWDAIKGIVHIALDSLQGYLAIFKDIFTGNWSKLWEDCQSLVQTILDDVARIFLSFVKSLVMILDGLIKTMSVLWGETFTGLDGAISTLNGYLDELDAHTQIAANGMWGLVGAANALKSALSGVAGAPEGAPAALPKGGLAIKGGGGGGGGKGKKGGKKDDPDADVTGKIAELRKELYLQGDASDYAKLHYDLFQGELKKTSAALKATVLSLTLQAQTLKETYAHHKEFIDSQKELNLANATAGLVLDSQKAASERLYGKYKDWTKADYDATVALLKRNEAHALVIEAVTKYRELMTGASLAMLELTDKTTAAGIAAMGSAEAWELLTDTSKGSLTAALTGVDIFSELKKSIEENAKKLAELRGETAEGVGFDKLAASLAQWLKLTPTMTKVQHDFVVAFEASQKALTDALAKDHLRKLADVTGKAVGDIQKSIDAMLLKVAGQTGLSERWASFWDAQRAKVEEFLKLRPTITQYMSFLDALAKKGSELFKTQDEGGWRENYKTAMKAVQDQQEKINLQLAYYSKNAHAAAVAAVEFANGIRQMTQAQAEQVVQAEDALKKRENQIAQLQKVADNFANYIGGIFDELIHGKLQGVFTNAITGFKKMLQDMAAEYLKSYLKSILTKLFMGFAGGGDGGGFSGSGIPTLGLPHAENGGTINGMTMVGESGPEILGPSTSGFVLSNEYVRNLASITNRYVNAVHESSRPQAGSGGTVGGSSSHGPVHVHMTVNTPDVGGFKRSQSQIMEAAFQHAATAARRAGR